MAFNFNWSPLIADTDRVRHMLTSSLNKSPKPPIIVDDIIVNELNLGSTPPSLEILEIGDLAEDRFRGIFKVRYEGDAYLTLKTRVQANPLNTFLSTKPEFASPMPLAAGSGLTIPLQITLSDIRLSGFVILVFNKQKGITLVFRNDPLESLKVSSTFDSIPFVREYLQRTIEGQLRVLFMEDLPAIIHRLSLRVFGSEDQKMEKEREEKSKESAEAQRPVDAYASPSINPTEGQALGDNFLLDAQGETFASFSQKNLLRLAALTESQKTLSLFTPSIRDTVYRAWASAADRQENALHRPTTLGRIQSSLNVSNGGWSSAASQASGSQATTPSVASHASMPTSYSLGSRPRAHGARKKKNRVVNLRKKKEGEEETASDKMSVSSGYTGSAGKSEHASAPEIAPTPVFEAGPSGAREGEIQTPPRSPKKKVEFQNVRPPLESHHESTGTIKQRSRPATPRTQSSFMQVDLDPTPRASMYLPEKKPARADDSETPFQRPQREHLPRMQTLPNTRSQSQAGKGSNLPRSSSELSISDMVSPSFQGIGAGSTGGILEQAWMMKMAAEIAKKVAEEKGRQGSGSEREAPPAYGI